MATMIESFYGWLNNQNKSEAVTMDEKRKVYRLHPDGTPCYAKNEEDCPLVQHHRKAEEADDLRGPVGSTPTNPTGKTSKKVETPEKFKSRMAGLVKRLNEKGWTPDLEADLTKAVDDVLDGRSMPSRMPQDTMRRDMMVDMPKWFLAAYHMACGADDSKTGTWDNKEANKVVEKVLKGLGKWTPNIYGKCQKAYGKPFGEGSESYVFKNGKDKVAKASTLGHTGNVVFAMERLMLSNLVFPETAHHIMGMGSMHGDTTNRSNEHVSFLLDQDKFKFKYFKTDAEANKAMAKRGFTSSYTDEFEDKAKEIRLLDCKKVNIPHLDSGRILFIDPCVSLNYGKASNLKTLSILGK